jgi:hypothetical protein
MKKNTKMSGKKKVAVGAGIVALAGGAYYLLGPNAKAHQKKASELMAKMKKEITSEIKKAKKLSTPLYHKAVNIVAKNYAKQYKMHEKDIKAIAQKLKSEWKGTNTTGQKTAMSSKNKKA